MRRILDSELMSGWIEERCELKGSSRSSELYNDFAAYCIKHDLVNPFSRNQFGHKLGKFGFVKFAGTDHERLVSGIRLLINNQPRR